MCEFTGAVTALGIGIVINSSQGIGLFDQKLHTLFGLLLRSLSINQGTIKSFKAT